MSTLAHRAVFDHALCHASLLVEKLLFYTRNLGLLPRTSTASDPLGSIVISDEDVSTILAGFRKVRTTELQQRASLLTDPLGEPLKASRAALVAAMADDAAQDLGFVALVRSLGISDGALDAFVLAIAPEWDARIGRLMGFLNNDATRHRPTYAHLLMALQTGVPSLDADVIATLSKVLFAPGVLLLDAAPELPNQQKTVRAALHTVEISSSSFAHGKPEATLSWDDLHFPEEEKATLQQALLREVRGRCRANRRLVILEGPTGSGRSAVARATASSANVGVVSTQVYTEEGYAFDREMTSAFFRARIRNAVLIIRSDGALKGAAERWHRIFNLTESLDVPCFVLVGSDEPGPSDSTIRFLRQPIPRTRALQRRIIWDGVVKLNGLSADGDVLDDISARYDITPGRIHELGTELSLRRSWEGENCFKLQDVRSALRDITVQKLKDSASLYVADLTLDDLVLPVAVRERLRELIHRMRYRYTVLTEWKFGGRSMRGYGVSAMFAGPAGTGKTAAAAAVARELEIDLYIVDLSRIMSKWVGETEQNLAKVFDEAEASNVALLFDEADSLFGKRSSEVHSSSDRYANLTVNYLLQRMESYSGLAFLTTNLESAIDSAFSRRITTRVCFDAPDQEHRLRLWQTLLPTGVRFADDVYLDELVQKLEMPGARIRTALLRAAFRAAASGRREPVLTQGDLHWAAAAEYEDMGRLPALARLPATREIDDDELPDPEETLPPPPNRAATPHQAKPQEPRNPRSNSKSGGFPFPPRR